MTKDQIFNHILGQWEAEIRYDGTTEYLNFKNAEDRDAAITAMIQGWRDAWQRSEDHELDVVKK